MLTSSFFKPFNKLRKFSFINSNKDNLTLKWLKEAICKDLIDSLNLDDGYFKKILKYLVTTERSKLR